MSRPLEHEDVVCFRLSSAMHQTLETAVAALGTTKSQLVRAIVVQALRHGLMSWRYRNHVIASRNVAMTNATVTPAMADQTMSAKVPARTYSTVPTARLGFSPLR